LADIFACFPGNKDSFRIKIIMGNGSIYRRGKAWCVNFTTSHGRRVRETVGPNKRVAEQVLSLRMTQVLENRYFPASRALGRMPFNEFGKMFLERVVPLMKSAKSEGNRVKAWMEHFGSRPIGQITRAEIEARRRERMTNRKPATINRDLSRLRRMLNVAVEWELLRESPMAGMKFLRENNARTRYLSIDECQRLISCCIRPHIRAIVTIALHSGMRQGEILSLEWRDLDFAAGFILVRDSKNGQPRHVPMDTALRDLFSTYPHRFGSDLIFPGSNGTRLTDIGLGFENARARAGLTNLRFHDLRHTFASQFMMAGGDLYVLREILGHKGIQMTMRYAHLSPAYKVKALDRMNNIWEKAPMPPTASRAVSARIPVTVASQASL
jgi:integrase